MLILIIAIVLYFLAGVGVIVGLIMAYEKGADKDKSPGLKIAAGSFAVFLIINALLFAIF